MGQERQTERQRQKVLEIHVGSGGIGRHQCHWNLSPRGCSTSSEHLSRVVLDGGRCTRLVASDLVWGPHRTGRRHLEVAEREWIHPRKVGVRASRRHDCLQVPIEAAQTCTSGTAICLEAGSCDLPVELLVDRADPHPMAPISIPLTWARSPSLGSAPTADSASMDDGYLCHVCLP